MKNNIDKATDAPQLLGFVDHITSHKIHGWAVNPEVPTERQRLVVMFDQRPVATICADLMRSDLIDVIPDGAGDGRHGFDYHLKPWELLGVKRIHVVDDKLLRPLDIRRYDYRPKQFQGTIHKYKVTGWGIDVLQPYLRETVFLMINGQQTAATRCAMFREDLNVSVLDGFFGFEFLVKRCAMDDLIEVVDGDDNLIVAGHRQG